MNEIEHGTYGGAQQHRKRGDLPVCRPCLDAAAAYQREYRRFNEGHAERERTRQRVRHLAHEELRDRHLDEWTEIYEAALAEAGLHNDWSRDTDGLGVDATVDTEGGEQR